ncbi:MAG: type II toxin-antitoxin system VapC family toxin [Tepidisphaeraceae bacterium]
MTHYLLDTNHASSLLRRIPEIRERVGRVQAEELSLSRPTIGELWFMIFNSGRVDANRSELETFLHDFTIIEFDAPAAIEFGRIRAEARRSGRAIAGIDAQIAAIARLNGFTLLTDDGDFSGVNGLRIENWLR